MALPSDKRHRSALLGRAEKAWLHGTSYISWDELYLWFDVTKIAKTPFRGIAEAFEEVTGNDEFEVKFIEARGGITLVVCETKAGKKLTDLAETAA